MRRALLLLVATGCVLTVPAAQAATKPKKAAASAPSAAPALIERGKLVFQHNCTACHGMGPGDDGSPQLPGTARLDAKYKGELPGPLERRSDLTADTLRFFIRNGSGPMPMFRKTEVSEADIVALGAYLKNSAASLAKNPAPARR